MDLGATVPVQRAPSGHECPIEVLATGLPLLHGAQFVVDITAVRSHICLPCVSECGHYCRAGQGSRRQGT